MHWLAQFTFLLLSSWMWGKGRRGKQAIGKGCRLGKILCKFRLPRGNTWDGDSSVRYLWSSPGKPVRKCEKQERAQWGAFLTSALSLIPWRALQYRWHHTVFAFYDKEPRFHPQYQSVIGWEPSPVESQISQVFQGQAGSHWWGNLSGEGAAWAFCSNAPDSLGVVTLAH